MTLGDWILFFQEFPLFFCTLVNRTCSRGLGDKILPWTQCLFYKACPVRNWVERLGTELPGMPGYLGDLWTLSMKFPVPEILAGPSPLPKAYSRSFLKFFEELYVLFTCQRRYDFFVIGFFIELIKRIF